MRIEKDLLTFLSFELLGLTQSLETEKSKRPEETVSWLKQSILAANYDNARTTNEFKEVAADALKYVVEGDVLICWEHARLINIAEAIGVTNPIPYPDDR